MIHCIELSQNFESKGEMFKALKDNETKIISLKKSAIYKSAEKGQFLPKVVQLKIDDTSKAELSLKDDYIYPVINTTKYLDEHNDVHDDGIWTKTLKEQKGNILYVMDHSLKIPDIIAWSEDVNAFVKDVSWALLGANYEGKTQALIYEIHKSKIVNQNALKVIEENRKVQNSIRMQYVKIRFAVNSDDKEYAENKVVFDSYINNIANKEKALELGYFYLVGEAKISREGSMVIFGSNSITPILQLESKIQPETSTENKIEPLTESTQGIDYEFISKNFKLKL